MDFKTKLVLNGFITGFFINKKKTTLIDNHRLRKSVLFQRYIKVRQMHDFAVDTTSRNESAIKPPYNGKVRHKVSFNVSRFQLPKRYTELRVLICRSLVTKHY